LEAAHRDLAPAFSAGYGTLFRWKVSARADGPANGTTFRWRPRIATVPRDCGRCRPGARTKD